VRVPEFLKSGSQKQAFTEGIRGRYRADHGISCAKCLVYRTRHLVKRRNSSAFYSSYHPPHLPRISPLDTFHLRPPSNGRASSTRGPQPLVDLRSILGRFSVDLRSILCRFSVDLRSILCRSSVDSRSILCRSSVDSLSIFGRFSVDSLSIFGRFSVDLRSILCRSSVDSLSIFGRFLGRF
jgi:hypothetical protein